MPSTTGAKSLPCGSREGSKAPSVVVTLSTVIGRLPSVSVLVSVLSNELSKSVTELVGLRFGVKQGAIDVLDDINQTRVAAETQRVEQVLDIRGPSGFTQRID
ncbi:MAG TPA: hypothetical protein VMC78_07190 [Mycobacterium sp.]|nr:hypothetical protein [Mycobacterium sp.]